MTALIDNTAIVYQPQVHVRSDNIYAFEALLPNTNTLDEHAYFEQCLTTLAHWQQKDVMIPLAVTLSANCLSQAATLEQWQSFRHAHGQQATLILQVSPTPFHHGAALATCLARFQALGARVCLIAFGSGDSCYDTLRQIPCHSITLSTALIEQLTCNTQDFTLVNHLIHLMRDLNKQVIVKNIADVTLGTLLLQMGIEYLQGDAIATTMSAEDALSWQATCTLPDIWHAPDANPWPDAHQHLLKATVAHRQWLKQLERDINTGKLPSQRHAEVKQASHLRCELGRWMSNQGIKTFGHLQAFTHVDSLHQAFHHEADNLMLCARHHATHDELVPLWQRTQGISQTLTAALLNLKNSLYTD